MPPAIDELFGVPGLFTLFGRHFRLANFIEIALVSAFFYLVITWLQQSITRRASRNALVAVLLFATVYVLARLLDLYFITLLIERSFIVLLLMAVVIFQHDIRRMIDRIGRLRFKERPPHPWSTTPVVNLLAEAAGRLAESRTGALIAVRGQDAWDHEIEGGVVLDGLVSLPLLYSLFSPETPGHDGAVLVERDRVVRFSAHLPLTSSIPEVSRFGGTRHAAAIGLSEVCDAFVIVVSEERGTISVAQSGHLTQVETPAALKPALESFWQKHYAAPPKVRSGWWRRPKAVSALLSVALAVLFWVSFTRQGDTVYRTYTIPIELRNVRTDWLLADPVPSEARVTLSGSDQAFRLLDPASLVVSFDLSGIEPGLNELFISEEHLRLPSNLELYDAAPQVLRLQAKRLQPARVRVEVRTKGTLPDSLELAGLTSTPDSVTVMVPVEEQPPRRIETEPVDLDRMRASSAVRQRLVPPPGTRLPPNQSQEVTVQAQVRTRSAGDLP